MGEDSKRMTADSSLRKMMRTRAGRRIGAWTLSEFVIFNIAIAAVVAGVVLGGAHRAPGGVTIGLSVVGLLTVMRLGAVKLARFRRESRDRGR